MRESFTKKVSKGWNLKVTKREMLLCLICCIVTTQLLYQELAPLLLLQDNAITDQSASISSNRSSNRNSNRKEHHIEDILIPYCAGVESALEMNKVVASTHQPLVVASTQTTNSTTQKNTSVDLQENEDVTAQYIRMSPGVTSAMLTPDFWLQDYATADEIILTIDEIRQKNEDTLRKLESNSQMIVDIWNFPATIPKTQMVAMLSPATIRYQCYVNGISPKYSYFTEMKKNYNVNAIAKNVEVRYGICVKETNMYSRPTTDRWTTNADSLSSDIEYSSLLVNEPVLVLHESADRQWYYVQSYFGADWVLAESIALCRSKEEWLAAQDFEDRLLMVTGDKVYFQMERTNPEAGRIKVSMGTKLELVPVSEMPEYIDERYVYDNYVIKMPMKNAQGMLEYEYKAVTAASDVHIGYLDYTTRNVLTQAFKMLGNVYGWGDMYDSRDCSSYIKTVYRCFGFQFVRNSSWQTQMAFPTKTISGMTNNRKKAVLNELAPGSLLQFSGHITMYLGHVGSKYYCISATGTCKVQGSKKQTPVSTLFINDVTTTYRANGVSWLGNFAKAVEIK